MQGFERFKLIGMYVLVARSVLTTIGCHCVRLNVTDLTLVSARDRGNLNLFGCISGYLDRGRFALF